MNERIRLMAESAVARKDPFPAGIPEKVENKDDLKNPVEIGKGLYRYLAKQPIEILENELIVGRTRFEGCGYTGDFYKRTGHLNTNKAWYERCGSNPKDALFYWGWTHITLDFDYILNNGLNGYLKQIEVSKSRYINDLDKLELLDGMKAALEGVINFCGQYASKAKKSRESKNLGIAQNCERVPMLPAESFYEAVQSLWFCFLLCPDSLGRIDQYLYPFYLRDTESGVITKDFASELLEELFVKVFETQMNHPTLWHISGHNHMVVGGYLENGDDGFNELSKVILEIVAKLPTFRPQISFRYTSKTTPETVKYITELNKKCPLIVFVNDEPRIQGLINAGIAYKDAVNYTIVGCNELCIAGKAKIDLAHINLLNSLSEALYNRSEKLLKCKSFDEVYTVFEQSLERDIFRIADEYGEFFKAQAKDVNVLTSALFEDCITSATTVTNAGCEYYGLSMSFNGVTNAADSLSVIKQFVFDEKRYTMAELLDILGRNWSGYEDERNFILKKGRFFGNDDDYVDGLACDIVNSIYKSKNKIQRNCIKNLLIGSFVGATNPNIILGKMTRATPDGRYDGEGITMGISQSMSKDKSGLTALLKSIAKIDYQKFCGCVVSNIKLDKSIANTDAKIKKLSELYHTFLQMGGMQLQINYLSSEELKKAQQNPDEYRNLMVRVTGYSGYFTEFDKDLQDDIISRTDII